jgi:VWFA-related protein
MARALAILLILTTVARGDGLLTHLAAVDLDGFPTIAVPLTVYTAAGRPVPGLTRDAFTLAEDGKPVALQEVAVKQTPIDAVLVIDTSGSMAPAMTQLKAAVGAFVRDLAAQDRVALIAFADQPVLKQSLTADRRPVLDTVNLLEASGATALYDAIRTGLDGYRGGHRRRLMVLFTDGQDQNRDGTGPQSANGVKGVVKLAQERQVSICTIGLGPTVNDKMLRKIAQVTGGLSYHPRDVSQLRAAFDRLLVDVRLEYQITYQTPKPATDGTLRRIQVTSKAQGVTGQGAASYTAPSPPPPSPVAPSPRVAAAGTDAVAHSAGGPVRISAVAVTYGTFKIRGFGSEVNHTDVFATSPDGTVPKQQPTRRYSENAEFHLKPGRYLVKIKDDHSFILHEFMLDIRRGETAVITPQALAPAQKK